MPQETPAAWVGAVVVFAHPRCSALHWGSRGVQGAALCLLDLLYRAGEVLPVTGRLCCASNTHPRDLGGPGRPCLASCRFCLPVPTFEGQSRPPLCYCCTPHNREVISPGGQLIRISTACSYSTAAFPALISEYLVELREYGPVYSTWGGLEDVLAEPLEGVSACIGNCSSALEELTEDMMEDSMPVLREYVLYSESMKNVLKKRDQVQAEYEAKLEAAALKREERTGVPTEVEKCQDRVECFNADLKADMERWQNNKRQDFKQLLMGMADKNIQYYEKCLSAWESIIPLLQDKPDAK